MNARRKPRPRLPYEEQAAQLAYAKPQYKASADAQMDTRELQLSKIHPDRDPDFLRALRFEDCQIKGHPLHPRCWNPDRNRGRNQASHCGKAYSGRKKRSDSQSFTLCALAADEQELNMDAFDQKYGINRFEVAARQRAKYLAAKE